MALSPFALTFGLGWRRSGSFAVHNSVQVQIKPAYFGNIQRWEDFRGDGTGGKRKYRYKTTQQRSILSPAACRSHPRSESNYYSAQTPTHLLTWILPSSTPKPILPELNSPLTSPRAAAAQLLPASLHEHDDCTRAPSTYSFWFSYF